MTTTVSAPGKVLLAGGYLVLESPNVGLVIAANQRFYCTVESSTSSSSSANKDVAATVRVDSPQFHSSWTYYHHHEFHQEEGKDNTSQKDTMKLWQADSQSSKNQFVESTLRLILAYVWCKNAQTHPASDVNDYNDDDHHRLRTSLIITIRADNDFYSLLPHLPPQPPLDVPTYLSLLSDLPRFVPCPLDETTGKPRIHKTGLGSSAALVTSLVAAMYYHCLSSSSSSSLSDETSVNEQDMAKIHRLAQLCHCHAQGKVGSGFDVSAAIHGSHVYQKQFPPVFYQLMTLLEQQSSHHEPVALPMSLARQIQQYVDSDDSNNENNQSDGGNVLVAPISLNAVGLQLVLADVSGGGSESPSMARQVLAWKEQQQQQQAVSTNNSVEKNEWDQLKDMNQRIVELLHQLTKTASSSNAATYHDELKTLSQLPASQWKNGSSMPSASSLLYELHTAFQATRYSLKSMGTKAGVPIEPNVQTDLCDATMALPGVVTALVPGAGGYDAIACLYIDRPHVREGILELWLNWKASNASTETDASALRILPLSVTAVGFGEGLRIETN